MVIDKVNGGIIATTSYLSPVAERWITENKYNYTKSPISEGQEISFRQSHTLCLFSCQKIQNIVSQSAYLGMIV